MKSWNLLKIPTTTHISSTHNHAMPQIETLTYINETQHYLEKEKEFNGMRLKDYYNSVM